MNVSIEALVTKSHMENGIEIEERWIPLGTTVLGRGVAPAVAGAHIRALSEESGFENLKLRAASFLDTSGDEGEKEEPHANTQIKPQNEKIVKEKEAIMKAFSKKQLATLSAKFPEYSLLTAGQDDNGVHVCMMGADGEMAVYTMADMNETIVPEKTLHVNSQVVFEFGEDKLAVDLCDVTDQMSANAVKANSKIEKLEKDLETANETIRTMQTAEKARRVKACTDKVDALVAEFNAAREDKIDCAMFNSIKEAINNGDYSECVDSKGCWNGEQMVTLAAKAVMTDFQMEVDKRNASRNKSQYVWEMSADKNGGSDDVVSFIENFSFD